VIAAAHVIAAQPESVCPMLEYLLNWAPRQQHFLADPIVPQDGYVEPPTAPGLGIALDEAKVEERRELDWG
jgi:L-alanine-DL-glutamate epimerase-like enolase superfamily enzyme